MDVSEPKRRPFRIIDPRQKRIHERLERLVDPCAAAFFHDAVELMETRPPYQAFTHVVSHLIRDIQGAILDIVEPLSTGPSVKRDTPDGHRTRVRRACQALGFKATDQTVDSWLEWCGGDNAQGFHKRAHRVTAGLPRPLDSEFVEWWNQVQFVFDSILQRQETRFLVYVQIMDNLLALRVPNTQDAAKLKKSVPDSYHTRRYFFDRLKAPDWLAPLQKEGFFDHPPSPRPDEERGLVSFSIWPQSGYLARISSSAPESVRDLILSLSDIDNPYIMEDLLQAANKMPANVAKDLVPQVLQWLEKQYGPYRIEVVGDLAAQLAEGGEHAEALDLARALLRVDPTSAGEQVRRGRVRRHSDTWDYQRILANSVPRIVACVGEPAFTMLCDLLEQAVLISASAHERRRVDDYSNMWHDAVESDSDSTHGDVRSLLVAAVRDAALRIVDDRRISAGNVVRVLERRRWPIFRRIALHVLRVVPDSPRSMVAKRLVRKRSFARIAHGEHEYAILLRDAFGRLRDEEQRAILSWIASGPDLTVYRRRYEHHIGTPPSDCDVDGYVRQWKYDRLALIADHLPSVWSERYEQYRAEVGKREPLDVSYHRHSFAWVGTESPKSADELNAMEVQGLVEFLRDWRSDGRFDGPSYDGLEEQLTEAVAAVPTRYAEAARTFRGLCRPGYVTALLYGFRRAVEGDKRFNWSGVLDLCTWVLGQPIEVEDTVPYSSTDDHSWSTARYVIAMLMEKAFVKGSGLPLRLRAKAWAVLQVLADDFEVRPNPDGDVQSGGTDGEQPALDTTRSNAIEAVIRYAVWVCGRSADHASPGLCAVPEARAVLERHLDPLHDPSVPVRMAYGRFLPSLVWLDMQWVRDNVGRVFPQEQRWVHLRRSAWNAYLKFCQPYSNVLDVLTGEYEWAVEQLPSTDGPFGKSDEDLAQHLMVYYWWGKIDLQAGGNLLQMFFSEASDELRSHAISFIGRSLGPEESRLPPVLVDRFMRLWDWRVAEVRQSADKHAYWREISAFGWWFKSSKFPREWAKEQLYTAVQLVGWIEPEEIVLKQLVDEVHSDPDMVLDCLDRVFHTAVETEGWRADSLLKPAHAILEQALQIETARSRALGIVNSFGAAGYIAQFRDLADRYASDQP